MVRNSVLTAPYMPDLGAVDSSIVAETGMALACAREADKIYYRVLLTTKNELTAMRAYCAALTQALDKLGAAK